MPAKNPRINVTLEDPLYKNIQFLANKDVVTLSAKVRDLIKEAIEIQEDILLAAFAEKRDISLDNAPTLTHEEAWS